MDGEKGLLGECEQVVGLVKKCNLGADMATRNFWEMLVCQYWPLLIDV